MKIKYYIEVKNLLKSMFYKIYIPSHIHIANKYDLVVSTYQKFVEIYNRSISLFKSHIQINNSIYTKCEIFTGLSRDITLSSYRVLLFVENVLYRRLAYSHTLLCLLRHCFNPSDNLKPFIFASSLGKY